MYSIKLWKSQGFFCSVVFFLLSCERYNQLHIGETKKETNEGFFLFRDEILTVMSHASEWLCLLCLLLGKQWLEESYNNKISLISPNYTSIYVNQYQQDICFLYHLSSTVSPGSWSVSFQVNERKNERTNEWKNEWTNEWVNEWMDICTVDVVKMK